MAGLTEFRHDLAEFVWRFNSPTWRFSEDTFNRTVAALTHGRSTAPRRTIIT
ncbi:MAG TPA: hypothetical protein VGZ32_22370 [Actinocrinis sp.]|nr:hypothetical protein [Actinocrinis sp.]